MLIVMTPEYRTEYLPVYLSYPDSVDRVTIDPVVINPRWPGHVRMLFGGDVAFGRRFLDPSNQTPLDQIPEDHPEALIQASDPETGTNKYYKPFVPGIRKQITEFLILKHRLPTIQRHLTWKKTLLFIPCQGQYLH